MRDFGSRHEEIEEIRRMPASEVEIVDRQTIAGTGAADSACGGGRAFL
jgi:hypothetical protein